MVRLLAVAGGIAVIIVFFQTRAPQRVELPPTPSALCVARDVDTATVIRVTTDGRAEVTPCPREQ